MSEDTYERIKKIAESGIETGRYPLDSGGMDTDDEVWIYANPQYVERVENVYKELLEEKTTVREKITSRKKTTQK